jgi:hypothetical protein
LASATEQKAADTGMGYLALPVAWLIPGLGHMLIGERLRGIVFLIVIHGLFAFGMLVAGIRAINPSEQPIWTYTQFLAGWPTLVAYRVERSTTPDIGRLPEQYKAAYPGGADQRDVDLRLQSQPEGETRGEQALPEAQREAARKKHAEIVEKRQKAYDAFAAANPNFTYNPKTQDIGAVYCGIAGMLNLLVLFDVLLRVTGNSRHEEKQPAGVTP